MDNLPVYLALVCAVILVGLVAWWIWFDIREERKAKAEMRRLEDELDEVLERIRRQVNQHESRN